MLVAQPVRGFGNSRHHWCTYLNVRNMYDDIYDVLVENKLAEKLTEHVMMDGGGKVVTDKKEQVGRKVTHKFTHPGLVYVFDETGCNTSQENDGRRGNQKFICACGTTPQKAVATKSNHFTTLGVTALDGTPVMCCVIFAAKVLKGYEGTGLNIHADEIGTIDDKEYIKNNSGKGKRFPGGPTCEVNGKQVPTLV